MAPISLTWHELPIHRCQTVAGALASASKHAPVVGSPSAGAISSSASACGIVPLPAPPHQNAFDELARTVPIDVALPIAPSARLSSAESRPPASTSCEKCGNLREASELAAARLTTSSSPNSSHRSAQYTRHRRSSARMTRRAALLAVPRAIL